MPLQLVSNYPYAMAGEIYISHDRRAVLILSPSGSALGIAAKIIAPLVFVLITALCVMAALVGFLYAAAAGPLPALTVTLLLVVLLIVAIAGWFVNLAVSISAVPGAFETIGLSLPGRRWTIHSLARDPSATTDPVEAFDFAARTILNEVPHGDWLVAAAPNSRLAGAYGRLGFRTMGPGSQVFIRPR